jgi:hypothetical protein
MLAFDQTNDFRGVAMSVTRRTKILVIPIKSLSIPESVDKHLNGRCRGFYVASTSIQMPDGNKLISCTVKPETESSTGTDNSIKLSILTDSAPHSVHWQTFFYPNGVSIRDMKIE